MFNVYYVTCYWRFKIFYKVSIWFVVVFYLLSILCYVYWCLAPFLAHPLPIYHVFALVFCFLCLEIWVSFVGFLSFAYVLGLWFMVFVCCIMSWVFVC